MVIIIIIIIIIIINAVSVDTYYCTALNAGRSSQEEAVCLSVVWIVTKRKKNLSIFLYHTKDLA